MRPVLVSVMLVCAAVALAQAGFFFTASDETLVQWASASARVQRDGSSPFSPRPTDADINAQLEKQRSAILSEMHGFANTLVGVRLLIAAALIATTIGLVLDRRNPTRLLAGFTGVPLLLIGLNGLVRLEENLRIYDYLPQTLAYSLDLVYCLLIPVTAIACLVVFMRPPGDMTHARGRTAAVPQSTLAGDEGIGRREPYVRKEGIMRYVIGGLEALLALAFVGGAVNDAIGGIGIDSLILLAIGLWLGQLAFRNFRGGKRTGQPAAKTPTVNT